MSEINKHDRSGDKDYVYWHNIKLLVKQIGGIYAGYKAKVRKRGVESTESITMNALWTINMDGDIIQLESAFNKGLLMENANNMAFRETARQHMIRGRKSASTKGHWKELLLNSLSHTYDYTDSKPAEKAAVTPARSVEAEWKRRVLKQRCSALVKLTDNNNDLLVAHTSWEVSRPHGLGLCCHKMCIGSVDKGDK